jgi:Cys-rich four helix bundle protein (predicted Tat secretion target)
MNRRELMAAAAGVAAVAASAPIAAAPSFAADAPAADALASLRDAALDCIKAGDACLAHCLKTFADGDTGLALCAKLVEEAAGMSIALAKLAALKSERLAVAARATMQFCEACEKECRKHADHHATCKACADACLVTIDACKKITA